MALTMSVRQRLLHLSLGVLLSSIIWDGVYLIVGATVGKTVVIKPTSMLLYSLGGLTALYLITLGVRYLYTRSRFSKNKATVQSDNEHT
jgi:membrane protein DedA with SNARE-associated domain